MIYKKLLGKKVSLGPITIEDAEKWARWLNDLEVAIPLGTEAYSAITVENMQETIMWFNENKQHVFSIIENESDKSIGRAIIFDVDHTNNKAMISLFIGERKYWDKKYGEESTRLLLDYIFNLLNINSVMLGVFEFNKRAIKCYKNVGFKEIGKRRNARLFCGKYYDSILMDMLSNEFKYKGIINFIESN